MNNIHFNKNKQKIVQEVFESSSSNYDLMNDLMSLGSHRLWKSKMIENINFGKSDVIIDVASGTGDLSKYILKKNQKQKIIRVDPNKEMLNKNAKFFKNYPNVSAVKSVAETLPIESNSIDIYLISFGLRNLVNIDHSLSEAYRVLKTGGRFMCLEFSKIDNEALNFLYKQYSKIIPLAGKYIVGSTKPYDYLVESIDSFYNQKQLCKLVIKNGFSNVEYRNLSNGISAIHSGWKI